MITTNNSPKKKQIPYIEILKQAGRVVWEHRFLLWFGLLMALGSPGSFNVGNNNQDFGKQGEIAKNFFENHWGIVLLLAIIFFIIGIILFIISLVAKAGLVKSVNLVSQNKKTNFKESWGLGKKYLGKLFKLAILFFLAVLAIVIVLAVPIIYLAAAKFWIGTIFVGILAVAISIPLIFIFALTQKYAEFYIILSGLRVKSAIEAGYNLLVKNIINSIIFWLLLLVVFIVTVVISVSVAGITLIILVPAGIVFYYLSKIAFAIFIAFAIILFLVVIFFIKAIFQTYSTAAWTLFFQEIAKVEKPEAETVAEPELEKPIAATPKEI
jgi:hypothetical protein